MIRLYRTLHSSHFHFRTRKRKAKIFSSILGSQNCLVLFNSPSSRAVMIENYLLKFDMSRSLVWQIFFQILFLFLNVKIVTWQHPSPPRQRRGRVERTPSATNISREIFPAGTSIIRLIFPVSQEPSSENLIKNILKKFILFAFSSCSIVFKKYV